MAQLISKSGKAAPAVDLTPMVDLGFLLIAFFMFTTTMSKPFAMDIQMPYKGEELDKPTLIKASTAMTLLLGKDHQLHYYEGMPEANLEDKLRVSGFEGRNNIRDKIAEKKAAINTLVAKGELEAGDHLVVMIKASDRATTDDLVKVLDEMAISKVPVYALTDISADEWALIK
ncbi:MAG: biopolymer transporter ExbD [Sphingobacteriales bacterium]|nr:MAG: biopolymer transporter ExbD [Sphingobacteriales bacterium]